MERVDAKVIALFVTFILPFIFNLLPYKLSPWIARKGSNGKRVLCYLMCFGGGIFFGTFLLHIAPESRGILDETLLDPKEIVYPVTDLIIGLGLFFVLYLEKIVMRINKRRRQRDKKKNKNKLELEMERNDDSTTSIAICVTETEKPSKDGLGLQENIEETLQKKEPIKIDSNDSGFLDREAGKYKNSDNNNNDVTTKTVVVVDSVDPSLDIGSGKSNVDEEEKDAHNHSNMRSLILIMALALHHIFEGMSLGLQQTSQKVFTLLIALMCHEVIISFSLGLQFVKCRYSLKRMIITCFCCCIVSPIGVAIGMIMSEVGAESNELEIANGVFQAFAAGTFIYVTFFEILQEEIDPHDTSIGKVTAVFIGFMSMALLMMLPEDTGTHAPER